MRAGRGAIPRRALRVHIQRVDRLARGHEQAVALQAAEAEVGAALGQGDAADHDAVGREHHDAVEFGIAHAPAAPQIAVDVGAHAVGRAGAGVDEDALVGKLVAAGRDVIGENLAGRHAAEFDDVENLLVRREAQPVRPQNALGDDGGLSGRAVDPVDVHVDLGLGLVALVIAEQAEHRIGEPDRAVGFHDHVVRRVQPLAVEGVHQHRDRAVIFGAGDPAAAVLAGDQAALAVAGVAVGEIRRLAEDADRAGLLFPLEDALVGNVAAQQIAPVAEPHRPFGPAQAGGQPFHRRQLAANISQSADRARGSPDRDNRSPGASRRVRCCIGHLLFSLLLRFLAFGLLSFPANDRKSVAR